MINFNVILIHRGGVRPMYLINLSKTSTEGLYTTSFKRIKSKHISNIADIIPFL